MTRPIRTGERGKRILVMVPLAVVGTVLIGLAVAFLPAEESELKGESIRPACAKSARGVPHESDSAATAMSHLLGKEPEVGIHFEDFVRQAKLLDDSALRKLIDEIGVESGPGYKDWVRCALFMEWGRRDLDGALAFVREHRLGGRAGQPILHSIFVGSRPEDPEEALKYLDGLIDDPRYLKREGGKHSNAHETADWMEVAYERVVAEIARIDPERARELHPVHHGTWSRRTESAADLVKRTDSIVANSQQSGVSVSQNHFTQRLQLIEWAHLNPGSALQTVRENSLPQWSSHLIVGLLRGDTHLATPVAEFLAAETGEEHFSVALRSYLSGAMNYSSSLQDRDRFPEPGLSNRPPDYLARYETLRAVMGEARLSEKARTILLAELERAFERS